MTDKKEEAGKTREIALTILIEIIEKNNFSHKVIGKELTKHQQLSKQERSFITRICDGTIERLLTIDYMIGQYSSVKINKMKPLIRNLLRMSVYQLKYMDQIPDSAVCNEAVKIAKKRGFNNLSGFVNGVLRSIIREPDKIKWPNKENEPIKYLSIHYSTPEWLVSTLLNQYEYNTVNLVLESFLTDKITTIRCNQSKISPEQLISTLEKEQVQVCNGDYLPYALKIDKFNYLAGLNSFMKGYFLVQDESSMLVSEIAHPQKEDYVIDVCAAPGGKSLHIADKLEATGIVDARDVSEYKTTLIKENIKRLNYTNITVKVQDATQVDEKSIGKADIVIADLPCSGIGVIGKKPDIKYNLSNEQLDELVKLQQKILDVVSLYVKPNGALIYSTCTINKKENIDNVRWFTSHYPFELESIDEFVPEVLCNEDTRHGYLQLIPGIHKTDGFFIAKLRKCEGITK